MKSGSTREEKQAQLKVTLENLLDSIDNKPNYMMSTSEILFNTATALINAEKLRGEKNKELREKAKHYAYACLAIASAQPGASEEIKNSFASLKEELTGAGEIRLRHLKIQTIAYLMNNNGPKDQIEFLLNANGPKTRPTPPPIQSPTTTTTTTTAPVRGGVALRGGPRGGSGAPVRGGAVRGGGTGTRAPVRQDKKPVVSSEELKQFSFKTLADHYATCLKLQSLFPSSDTFTQMVNAAKIDLLFALSNKNLTDFNAEEVQIASLVLKNEGIDIPQETINQLKLFIPQGKRPIVTNYPVYMTSLNKVGISDIDKLIKNDTLPKTPVIIITQDRKHAYIHENGKLSNAIELSNDFIQNIKKANAQKEVRLNAELDKNDYLIKADTNTEKFLEKIANEILTNIDKTWLKGTQVTLNKYTKNLFNSLIQGKDEDIQPAKNDFMQEIQNASLPLNANEMQKYVVGQGNVLDLKQQYIALNVKDTDNVKALTDLENQISLLYKAGGKYSIEKVAHEWQSEKDRAYAAKQKWENAALTQLNNAQTDLNTFLSNKNVVTSNVAYQQLKSLKEKSVANAQAHLDGTSQQDKDADLINNEVKAKEFLEKQKIRTALEDYAISQLGNLPQGIANYQIWELLYSEANKAGIASEKDIFDSLVKQGKLNVDVSVSDSEAQNAAQNAIFLNPNEIQHIDTLNQLLTQLDEKAILAEAISKSYTLPKIIYKDKIEKTTVAQDISGENIEQGISGASKQEAKGGALGAALSEMTEKGAKGLPDLSWIDILPPKNAKIIYVALGDFMGMPAPETLTQNYKNELKQQIANSLSKESPGHIGYVLSAALAAFKNNEQLPEMEKMPKFSFALSKREWDSKFENAKNKPLGLINERTLQEETINPIVIAKLCMNDPELDRKYQALYKKESTFEKNTDIAAKKATKSLMSDLYKDKKKNTSIIQQIEQEQENILKQKQMEMVHFFSAKKQLEADLYNYSQQSNIICAVISNKEYTTNLNDIDVSIESLEQQGIIKVVDLNNIKEEHLLESATYGQFLVVKYDDKKMSLQEAQEALQNKFVNLQIAPESGLALCNNILESGITNSQKDGSWKQFFTTQDGWVYYKQLELNDANISTQNLGNLMQALPKDKKFEILEVDNSKAKNIKALSDEELKKAKDISFIMNIPASFNSDAIYQHGKIISVAKNPLFELSKENASKLLQDLSTMDLKSFNNAIANYNKQLNQIIEDLEDATVKTAQDELLNAYISLQKLPILGTSLSTYVAKKRDKLKEAKGYQVHLEAMDPVPTKSLLDTTHKQNIPMLIQDKNGMVYMYGYDENGSTQLTSMVDNPIYSKYQDLDFNGKKVKLNDELYEEINLHTAHTQWKKAKDFKTEVDALIELLLKSEISATQVNDLDTLAEDLSIALKRGDAQKILESAFLLNLALLRYKAGLQSLNTFKDSIESQTKEQANELIAQEKDRRENEAKEAERRKKIDKEIEASKIIIPPIVDSTATLDPEVIRIITDQGLDNADMELKVLINEVYMLDKLLNTLKTKDAKTFTQALNSELLPKIQKIFNAIIQLEKKNLNADDAKALQYVSAFHNDLVVSVLKVAAGFDVNLGVGTFGDDTVLKLQLAEMQQKLLNMQVGSGISQDELDKLNQEIIRLKDELSRVRPIIIQRVGGGGANLDPWQIFQQILRKEIQGDEALIAAVDNALEQIPKQKRNKNEVAKNLGLATKYTPNYDQEIYEKIEAAIAGHFPSNKLKTKK